MLKISNWLKPLRYTSRLCVVPQEYVARNLIKHCSTCKTQSTPLKKEGIEVKRFAINQAPLAFTSNPVVKEFIMKDGPAKLPVTVFNGKIIKKEGYPSLDELQLILHG
ncbi:MAG: arsenic metallochaperone ArsD family protein [Bacteroidales bacterium]|nr:arsenic metallochaperone ArsD family protein [Bacteroidales bacterium]